MNSGKRGAEKRVEVRKKESIGQKSSFSSLFRGPNFNTQLDTFT